MICSAALLAGVQEYLAGRVQRPPRAPSENRRSLDHRDGTEKRSPDRRARCHGRDKAQPAQNIDRPVAAEQEMTGIQNDVIRK